MAATCLRIAVNRGVASPLGLTTVCKCQGAEETSYWSFGRCMIYMRYRTVNVQHKMRQISSVGERSGLQAGRFSTWTIAVAWMGAYAALKSGYTGLFGSIVEQCCLRANIEFQPCPLWVISRFSESFDAIYCRWLCLMFKIKGNCLLRNIL